MPCPTNLLISASTSESVGSDMSASVDDVGPFISYSVPKLGIASSVIALDDISDRVNNRLGLLFFKRHISRRGTSRNRNSSVPSTPSGSCRKRTMGLLFHRLAGKR